jgi:hypothetical protein
MLADDVEHLLVGNPVLLSEIADLAWDRSLLRGCDRSGCSTPCILDLDRVNA